MPDPIPVNYGVPSILPYQFHQVAIFTPNAHTSAKAYVDMGFDNWIMDEAKLVGYLYGQPVVTNALMLFNYDAMPMELEFLEYRGPSRWSFIQGYEQGYFDPFISHMSAYVDDVVQATHDMIPHFGPPFHRFITQEHTNPNVVGKKRFIESIFDTRDALGYDLKLIEKVPWDYQDRKWLDLNFG